MIKIIPYMNGSKSAKDLRDALGRERAKLINASKRTRGRCIVLNWGNSEAKPGRFATMTLNKPESVALAINKKKTFEHLSSLSIPIPEFTSSMEQAKLWIQDEETVICRTILSGHSGSGIVVAKTVDELVACPLYTKYFKGKQEFRVHVFRGQVIDFCEKKKRSGMTDINYFVRSYSNGWVFCRDGVVLPDAVKDASINAVNALGLDFGAVDVRFHERNGACILEVNTAPAITGTTLLKYKQAIESLME